MCLVFDVDDYESITVNTVIGITAAKILDHNYALITVETDQIRIRVDGNANPTAAEGHLFEAGDTFELMGGRAIINFRAIKVTNNATLRVSLGYREEGMP